jgi:hypothetical protein
MQRQLKIGNKWPNLRQVCSSSLLVTQVIKIANGTCCLGTQQVAIPLSFIRDVAHPSWLHVINQKKKLYILFIEKGKSLRSAYFWSNWAQKWIATKQNDLSHLGLKIWTKLHTLFVSFTYESNINSGGPLPPPPLLCLPDGLF